MKMSSNLVLSKLDQELMKSNVEMPKKEPNSVLPNRSQLFNSALSLFSDEERSEESKEEQQQQQQEKEKEEKEKEQPMEPKNSVEKDALVFSNEASSHPNSQASPIDPVSTLQSARSNASDSDVLLIPINALFNSRSKSQESSQEVRRRSSELSSSQEGAKRKRRQSSDPLREEGKKRKKKPLNNRLITSFFGK